MKSQCTAFALLIFTTFVPSPRCEGGPVYELVPFVHVSTTGTWSLNGFIETDGTLGTITDANIVEWSVSFTIPNDPPSTYSLSSAQDNLSFRQSDPGSNAFMNATATYISLEPSTNTGLGGQLNFYNGDTIDASNISASFRSTSLDRIGAVSFRARPDGLAFGQLSPTDSYRIALVPEPSSTLSLAFFAIVSIHYSRRHR